MSFNPKRRSRPNYALAGVLTGFEEVSAGAGRGDPFRRGVRARSALFFLHGGVRSPEKQLNRTDRAEYELRPRSDLLNAPASRAGLLRFTESLAAEPGFLGA